MVWHEWNVDATTNNRGSMFKTLLVVTKNNLEGFMDFSCWQTDFPVCVCVCCLGVSRPDWPL